MSIDRHPAVPQRPPEGPPVVDKFAVDRALLAPVLRVPSRQSIFAIIRRASAISSALNCEKSFLRSTSRAEKTITSSGRSSRSSASPSPSSAVSSIAITVRSRHPGRVIRAGPLLLLARFPRRAVLGRLLAGDHLLHRGLDRRDRVHHLSPEPAKDRIKGWDLLRGVDQRCLCGRVEIVPDPAVDLANRFHERDQLPAADR